MVGSLKCALPIAAWFTLGLIMAPGVAAQAPAQRPAESSPDTLPQHTLSALLDGSGFVKIPRGEFMMGSRDGNPDEKPPRRVKISRDFEIGKFEVTQAQWVAVMRDPHARPKPGEAAPPVNPSEFQDPSRPVESVSWDAVQEFIRKINLRDPAHTYRLPTEAEWEYVATTGLPKEISLNDIAWYEANAQGQTRPVGEKMPNKWGVYDMLGNVFEWVQDWYDRGSYEGSPSINPRGGAPGSYKVYRGCAWLSAAKDCRPAYRAFDFPISGYYSVGFRLARTPK